MKSFGLIGLPLALLGFGVTLFLVSWCPMTSALGWTISLIGTALLVLGSLALKLSPNSKSAQ